ncbi:hypothetical protein C0V73_09690 [Rhizobium sp. TH135]|nr:hypothetical protein C0V73_09690 [Rhizobium sp. TH135]
MRAGGIWHYELMLGFRWHLCQSLPLKGLCLDPRVILGFNPRTRMTTLGEWLGILLRRRAMKTVEEDTCSLPTLGHPRV